MKVIHESLAFLLATMLSAGTVLAAPSFLVEPYLQNPGPDRMTIAWETSDTDNKLEYWRDGSSPIIVPALQVSSRDIWYASLTGLESNTSYAYRVVTSRGLGETYLFRTWPAPGDPVDAAKLVVFSDSQGDWPERLQDICETGVIGMECAAGLADECPEDIAAILVTGDLVKSGQDLTQWREQFFGRCKNLFHYVPVLPAIGNHDSPIDNYLAYFMVPSESGEEQWYYTDLLNLRLITLNTGAFDLCQWAWFDTLLSQSCSDQGVDYVLTQFHHACKSEVWTPGQNIQSCIFVARLQNFTRDCGKPSAHLFGHTHAYSRGQSRDVTHLWVNVGVSAGDIDFWGEEPPRDYDEFEVSYDEYGFVVVHLARGDEASLRMVRRTGGDDTTYYGFTDETIEDEFSIESSNNAPDVPQPLYPVGSEIEGLSVTLNASPFSDIDGDFHHSSHWQVTTIRGDYSAPVVDAWGNETRHQNIWLDQDTQTGVDITSYHVTLWLNQTFYWRVRYRDEHFGWSGWSEEASFSTVPGRPWGAASIGSIGSHSPSLALNMLWVLVPVLAFFVWKKRVKG